MRERDFAFFTGPLDTGYGISHFARDRGIGDTGFRILHGTAGYGIRDFAFCTRPGDNPESRTIPRDLSRGRNPREGPEIVVAWMGRDGTVGVNFLDGTGRYSTRTFLFHDGTGR